MEYLFLASIGPVQSFIASARRTRDLSFGSWLLSELAKAAAQEITKPKENILIFPAPQNIKELDPGTQLNVANKIIAVIHQSPQGTDETKGMGEKVREAIDKRLETIKNWAYTDMQDYNKQAAKAQIDDLVDYSWVALPFDGTNYAETREMLETLMAARKNTRDFYKVTWYSNQPKSSIDGQLESVIPENRYPYKKESDKEKSNKVKFLYKNYRAGPAERLSGVDLLKRKGAFQATSGLPSTSHMAALPFLARLTHLSDLEAAKQLWENYIKALADVADLPLETVPEKYPSDPILGRYEGSLLFEERLVDMVANVNNTAKLKPAQEALRVFFNEVDKQLGKAPLIPYYAILLADGDRMGQVIDHQAKQGENQHRTLSQALDKFARKVHSIVPEHQGELVYTGGDDVLAFVPLHKVLQCAIALANDFRKELAGFKDDEDHPPTLSVGIAIVHHLYSLQDALNLARATETRAKKVPGVPDKDALAITISKRSGDDYIVAGKWGDLDSYLEKLIGYCQSDAIPDGTAYELRDLALHLKVPTSHPDFQTLQKVILADAGRILKRKMSVPQHKLQQRSTEEIKKILNILQSRLGIKQEKPDATQTSSVGIEQFINELIVAQTLADAIKLTEPRKEQSHANLAH